MLYKLKPLKTDAQQQNNYVIINSPGKNGWSSDLDLFIDGTIDTRAHLLEL